MRSGGPTVPAGAVAWDSPLPQGLDLRCLLRLVSLTCRFPGTPGRHPADRPIGVTAQGGGYLRPPRGCDSTGAGCDGDRPPDGRPGGAGRPRSAARDLRLLPRRSRSGPQHGRGGHRLGLARGARAVFVGRPVLWALTVAGEAGVARCSTNSPANSPRRCA
ncbi:alpha-hydroxy-acid oxidizing protein [Streptomyces guryensis]|uniref:alpha-hydroxy-acid oxidizing protein n=1 Tax=Streptomyces guryensis TaxID=2886947 RepID=UPI003558DAE3